MCYSWWPLITYTYQINSERSQLSKFITNSTRRFLLKYFNKRTAHFYQVDNFAKTAGDSTLKVNL